eukprot:6582986-Alexandrium_andersonii.AAC.1
MVGPPRHRSPRALPQPAPNGDCAMGDGASAWRGVARRSVALLESPRPRSVAVRGRDRRRIAKGPDVCPRAHSAV